MKDFWHRPRSARLLFPLPLPFAIAIGTSPIMTDFESADDKIDYILGGRIFEREERAGLAAERRVLRHSPVDLWHAHVGSGVPEILPDRQAA